MVAIAAVLREPTTNDERVWSRVFQGGSRKRVYAPLEVIIGGAIVDALFLKSSCSHLPNSSVAKSLYDVLRTPISSAR